MPLRTRRPRRARTVALARLAELRTEPLPIRPWESSLMRHRILVPFVALVVAAAARNASALTLERVVRIDPARVTVTIAKGVAAVEAQGGTHEYAAGRPDLPWIAERIDLPAGMKLGAVEVVSAETQLLADGVQVLPALSARPGSAPDERSVADAAVFASPNFQPEALALPGIQGSLRGRNVAYVRIAPARWNPQTGQLERVSSLKLRLTLEDGAAPAVPRERIVREWEDELPSGIPSRAIVSIADQLTTGGRPKAEPFKALQLPSVLGSPVEYLIITNDAMAPTFQQLADWKTQSGVPAVVRTLS